MATLSTVRLNKSDSTNWGFRLQGGKDFGTPLVIQKVNGGSPAERAGLIAGDAVIRINNIDVFNLVHKDAQDVIVRAGPSFEMVIQRGGSTWKPSVIPTGSFPKSSPSVNNTTAVTKTSLAASKTDNIGSIGTGHNLAAKPFAPQVNGTSINENSPKLINKQYNSPLKLYSEDAIAETISAQSEVLSTGALGVNFKKNEKNYDSTNSAVYRMLKEAEKEPSSTSSLLHESVEPDSGIVTAPNKALTGLRHVEAPQHQLRPSAPANPQLPPGQNVCVECERLIVGVFVRIKDKNLHVECFKCATCGSSLKNVGYYNINQKLYCDIHAKAAALAINNPTAVPLASPRAPVSAISSALSQHSLPSSSGPLSPKTPNFAPSYPRSEDIVVDDDFNTKPSSSSSYNSPPTTAPLSFSKYINKSSASGIKPFSSVSAPLSPGGTLLTSSKNAPSNFNKAPLSPPTGHSYGSYSPASTEFFTNNIEKCEPLTLHQLPTVPVFTEITISIPPSHLEPSMQSISKCDPSSLSSAGRIFEKSTKMSFCDEGVKRVKSELLIPIDNKNKKMPLPDYLTFSNKDDDDSYKLICCKCYTEIKRGPFITALGKIWCPHHFVCATASCKRPLQDLGFVEENGQLYCEYCFEQYLAPNCAKCNAKVKADCLKAIGKNFHPECFNCTYCGKLFGNNPFFLEDGSPYCEADWNELFTTKCYACGFPVEAGDRWVEALNNNYHSQCFNCTMCKKNLEGQSFFAKSGRPYCKAHAR